MSSVDEYLKKVTPSQRAELGRIRQLVKQIAPEAEESISYGVPTFKYGKRPLIYFAAFKNHMSLFPTSDGMIEALGEKVSKFRTSRGTLRFTEDNPIPQPVIKEIILYRLENISID